MKDEPSLRPGAIQYIERDDPRFITPTRDPLLQEREKTHGSFADVAANASNIKLAYRHSKHSQLSAQHREALDMIATKIARIISGNANTKDHWNDIAGYAKLGSEACE